MVKKYILKENDRVTHITSIDELMPLIKEQLSYGQSVRFSPKGKSMLPMLRENRDSVMLSPIPEMLKKYDLPLYQRENGQYVLHRIIEINKSDDTYTCIGDNQFVKEYGLRREQMIAIVTAFEHNGKEHGVTDISYQLYCRCWYYSRKLRYFWRRGIHWIRRKLKR